MPDDQLARRNVNVVASQLRNHAEVFGESDNVIVPETANRPLDIRLGRGGSIRLTLLDLYKSWLQIRPRRFNRLLHSGRVLQHSAVNANACIGLNILNCIRRNQQSLRADRYRGLMDALDS